MGFRFIGDLEWPWTAW